jgi:hypothetical protein
VNTEKEGWKEEKNIKNEGRMETERMMRGEDKRQD